MYRTVIEIKKNISGETFNKLKQTIENAFSNRAGSVKNSSTEPYKFIFAGGEADYGCLDLGVAELGFTNGFVRHVDAWKWLDDDPNENCDVLEIYSRE